MVRRSRTKRPAPVSAQPQETIARFVCSFRLRFGGRRERRWRGDLRDGVLVLHPRAHRDERLDVERRDGEAPMRVEEIAWALGVPTLEEVAAAAGVSAKSIRPAMGEPCLVLDYRGDEGARRWDRLPRRAARAGGARARR